MMPPSESSPVAPGMKQAPPDPDLLYSCRIDADDRIVEVGGAGLEASEADRARGSAAIGSSLYAHVSGHFTRRFLQSFISDARASATPQRRVYRCDSPESRRLMEMRSSVAENGDLILEHRLIEENDFDFPVHVQAASRRGLADYLRCSNCCKLRPIRSGIWREPEEYAIAGHTAQAVHTICPACQGGESVRSLILRPVS